MIYQAISWWPDAYHVFHGGSRIGIVNKRIIRNRRGDYELWFAHNYNFFSIKGEFETRTLAAEAIPNGPIHQTSDAFFD